MSTSIKQNVRIELFMEGSVNYHTFKIVGIGEGKPYEGTQSMELTVTEGGPLPFSFDIFSHAIHYGNKVCTKYPKEIPDFFKQCYPEGFNWARVTTYEDGGVLAVTQDTSFQEDKITLNLKVVGVNFPPNGPVMQKKTKGWLPSNEMVIPRHEGLVMYDRTALKLDGGKYLACSMETTYKTKKKVKFPDAHFHHLRVETTEESGDGKIFVLHQATVASYSNVPSKLGHH